MASAMVHAKQHNSGMTCLPPQFIKQRPFVGLCLGMFLATGFLPLLTYLLFTCLVVSLGMFLLVVVESGIIAMATITLLVFLIIPACIASGLSLLAYALYVAVSQMKILGSSSLCDPEKRDSREDLEKRCEEKAMFEGNTRFKRRSNVSGNDS